MANVPNMLTGLRLVLVPVFLLFLFAGDGHDTTNRITAFVVFAVAVITDRLDGSLARSYGVTSEFGKLADPIADKMLVGAALIGLSMLGDLPWWVTVIILIRKSASLCCGSPSSSAGDPRQPRRQTQDPGAGDRDRPVHPAAAQLAPVWTTVAWAVMWVAIVLTVVTGVDYIVSALRGNNPDG